MERSGQLSLVVGAFVLACLVATMVTILSLTAEKGIFTNQYHLVARFGNVQGLLAGAPVWLAGKSVGSVSMVDFDATVAEQPLKVTMLIDESVGERIRADSVATIGTIGVLGDSYVELSVGSPSELALAPGDELLSVDPINLYAVMAHATEAMDSISGLAEDLNNEVMVSGKDALESFTTLASNLNVVVESFNAEGGGARAANAMAAASDIMIQIREGDGLLHNVIYDDRSGEGIQSLTRSLASVEELVSGLNEIVGEVQDGGGLIHSLIYGGPEERDVVMEFIEAGARLNNILAKVDQGEGTVGLLLNDPTLFEDLKVLLGGAQRSTVVRTLVRMSLEQGS